MGLPAFQLPMFSKCDALPKTDFCDCLSKESMAFVKSKPPLPTASLRLLRAAVRATSSALWLHHAHPFVAAERRRITVACREAKGLVTELWSPIFNALSCAYVTAASKEQLSRLSFSKERVGSWAASLSAADVL